MFHPDVELPLELHDALVNGKLVIFAGAGVSMGPPSSLPGFEALARDVIQDALEERKEHEPLDQYLGRAEQKGVNVQLGVRRRLDIGTSKPTSLHRDLARIFGPPDRVRIVTTNFDRHFRTVLEELHGPEAAPIYVGPALPLGRDARGLIHLHGALEVGHHPLVLTDADFGRAYLTDAWATRFLVELFQKFVVCFIGYRHSEPPMRYIARSLPPGTPRFALIAAGEEGRWRELGIQPVPYPMGAQGNEHAKLASVIESWALFASRQALWHERRIRDLVALPPAPDPADQKYLRWAISRVSTLRFFTWHARGLEWLRFVRAADALECLFRAETSDAAGGSAELAEPIAEWIACEFMLQHPERVLELIYTPEPRLSWTLWIQLARELDRRAGDTEPEHFARWVEVLCTTRQLGWPVRPLTSLLRRCTPANLPAALLLFAHLLQPRLQARFYSRDSSDEIDSPHVSLSIARGTDSGLHGLRECWTSLLRPQLERCHPRVAAMLTEWLEGAHGLLSAAGASLALGDSLSRSRSAIEPHAQDARREAIDLVIDAARDLLDFLHANAPTVGDAWIAIWRESQAPLLRRLAIYGLVQRATEQPAEVLDEVLAAGWLRDDALHHETYQLVARAYSAAEEAVRERFVGSALAQLTSENPNGAVEDSDHLAYRRYNLLVWLAQAAPGSQVTVSRLEEAQKAHPDFGPRPYPDRLSWTFTPEGAEPKSPISAEELRASPPASQLDFLLDFEGADSSWGAPTREGLLHAVEDACNQSFDWSWELAEALRARGELDDRGLWQVVLISWATRVLEPSQWERVLELLDQHRVLDRQRPHAVVPVLEHALQQGSAAPFERLGVVREVAERMALGDHRPEDPNPGPGSRWLDLAFQHPAGRAAEVWIATLGALRERAGAAWTGIPAQERERLERVLASQTVAAQRARTVFAYRAHFLHALDADWMERDLLPLFDWESDPQQAAQAWDGRIVAQHWNEPLLSLLRPYLEQTFEHFESWLQHRRERLAAQLAQIALYAALDPWNAGWLRTFVARCDLQTRVAWAKDMEDELSQLDEEGARRVWARWIADYWRERSQGVPLPFEFEERGAMLGWIFGLRALVPEVVEHIVAEEISLELRPMYLNELVDAGFAAKHPQALAHLLRHLLASSERSPHGHLDAERLVEALIEAGAATRELSEICQDLAGLGSRRAGELEQRLSSSREESRGLA